MNRKFRSRQSLSLLPLSLLILSGNLKAGLVSAQTVKSEEVEENSQLAAELGDAVGAATAEREAIHEQRADRKTSQGLKSLANLKHKAI